MKLGHTFPLRTVIGLILLFLSQWAKAQCHQDLFGHWRSDKGLYIILNEFDLNERSAGEAEVGNGPHTYTGSHFYRNRFLRIYSYGAGYNKATDTYENKERIFEFKVITIDKQLMKIQPISEEMKSLFGQENLTLFNENFISFDNFVLDSIHFSTYSPYAIGINANGEMNLEERWKRKKSYSGKLNEDQLVELKQLVIRSEITSMSICELYNSCSDCFSHNVKVFHNNKLTFYHVGHLHESATSLIRFLRMLILETEWKRKKRDANNG